MTAVFEQILEMSLTAAVVIVVVMFIRLLLRKAPRKYSYALWSVAAFRLVCPVSFEAVFSLFTFTKQMELPEVTQIVADPTPTVSPGYFDSVPPGYFDSVPAVSGSVSDYIDPDDFFTYPVTTPPAAETPTVTQINWLEVAAVIWLIGLAALVIYGIVSYVRLRRRMSTAVLYADNIWQSDRVQSPFILGFAKPRIYLPFGLTMEQHRYVLAHETCHLERLDHIVRPLSFLILAVHWFNPLVWAAYYMMGRDMEMSCDEKVLSGGESVKAYSTTLLSFAANRRFPSPSPLAFGESGVKSRIKNALNWKKPRTWVTVIAIIVCIVVIVVCAANPKEAERKNGDPYAWTSTVTAEEIGFAEHYVVGAYGSASLSEAQLQELSEILNAIPEDALMYRSSFVGYKEGAVEIIIEGGVHSLSYLPDGSLILRELVREGYGAGRSEEWEVDSDALKAFMADVTKLEDTPAAPDTGYYQSAELLVLSPLSSAVGTDDSGYYYLLQGDELRLIHKSSGECFIHAADGDWQELSDEFLRKMEEGSTVLSQVGLWDTLRDERPTVRIYGDNKLLLNFGDELWVGTGHHNRSGNISLWDLYRLEKMTEEPVLPVEELVTWNADLTHDGVDETITLTHQEELGLYTLTVTNATGESIWTGEASTMHVGEAGFYLYQRDGKNYLMQWNPYGSTGSFYYHYEVFSLTEEGEEVPLASNTMEFVVMNEQTLLQLDIGALRAFEQEVNALLKDTIILISTYGGEPQYSTETETLCKLWTSMADSWEQGQWEILNSIEKLGCWFADLTHDGKNEVIEISRKTDESTTYYLDIRTTDGKDLWNAELHHWKTGWNGYYLYERGGMHYLLEWFPNGQQGWYSFAYRIYRLNEAAEPEIVEESSLQYDLGAAGYREKILTVDVEPLRAFEKKINALLQDAEVLLVVDENRALLGNPNAPVSDSWISPADEWEKSRQVYAAQLPLAWAGWEGDANLLNCVQEQTKLRMGSYELAYIDGPERIATAAMGTTDGYLYRVEYRPADYDAKTHQLTWHENEYFYLVTYEVWGESTGPEDDEWHFVGTLSEEELQSNYNTPDMLAQYDNDPYLAAVVETVNQWRDNQ